MAHCRFLGFARNDKKERVVVSVGLLPWDSAAVGAAGTPSFDNARSFGTTCLFWRKKVTGSHDDDLCWGACDAKAVQISGLVNAEDLTLLDKLRQPELGDLVGGLRRAPKRLIGSNVILCRPLRDSIRFR